MFLYFLPTFASPVSRFPFWSWIIAAVSSSKAFSSGWNILFDFHILLLGLGIGIVYIKYTQSLLYISFLILNKTKKTIIAIMKHGKIINMFFVKKSTAKTDKKQFRHMKQESNLQTKPIRFFLIPYNEPIKYI
jgi:hypothetical protein